jgi:hypothetical protein
MATDKRVIRSDCTLHYWRGHKSLHAYLDGGLPVERLRHLLEPAWLHQCECVFGSSTCERHRKEGKENVIMRYKDRIIAFAAGVMIMFGENALSQVLGARSSVANQSEYDILITYDPMNSHRAFILPFRPLL